MKRRPGQLYRVVLPVIFVLNLMPLTSVNTASIIHVPDRYPTIQTAINAASTGDTIVVRAGTYTENVKVNKSVTIKSASGADATIIQAANPGDHVFEVNADYVSIDGFTIKGANLQGSAGIYLIRVKGCTVANNSILDNAYGIFSDYSDGVSILENNVKDNGYGVYWSHSSNNRINNNNVIDCGFGIGCAYTSSDEIAQNIVKDIKNSAISLQALSDSRVLENNVTNSGNGISLHSKVRDNMVSGNYIANSIADGISLSEASNNTVSKNQILSSGHGIYIQYSSDTNTLYLNNLIANKIDVISNQSTTMDWHSSKQIKYTYNSRTFTNYLGNYWSDYDGSDSNGDGVGDTPHSINSGKDSYPLTNPFEDYRISEVTPESSAKTYSPSAPKIPPNILPPIIVFCVIVLAVFLSIRFLQWRAKKRDELFERVCKAIEKYEPPPRHSPIEIAYHWALFEYLRNKFPSNKVELETRTEDRARPDITIDHIAIEVKGPTGANDLDTLIAKCWKFSQHYTNIIFVLFAPKYRPQKLDQVKAEIRKRYPEITARFISK